MNASIISRLAVALVFPSAASQALGQGTSFTYQGRLDTGGGPYTGTAEFQPTLWTAVSGGAQVAPNTPATVIVGVTNGVFILPLNFGAAPFVSGAERWLQLEVRTTLGPFITLTPRQPITPMPYAITASNLSGSLPAGQLSGAISSANLSGTYTGAVSFLNAANRFSGNGEDLTNLRGSNLAPGSVGSVQLASGSALENFAASSQPGVGSGVLVLSMTESNAALLSAGYVKLGTIQAGETWQQRASAGAPTARYLHTAIWTGDEMIVWGGQSGPTDLHDGGRYNPITDSWRTLSTNGAPLGRREHTAVWTGSEMVVWGGRSGSTRLNSGGRYNPATDTWTAMTTNNGPSPRNFHSAVWTGSEMIIWGGQLPNVNTGGRYNPIANAWTPIPTNSAPAPRAGHTAVWTGSEMIVWGGVGSNTFNNGGRYILAANSWASMTTSQAPAGRSSHTAVWTGDEMIVWGGVGSDYLNSGGRYRPAANGWTTMATAGSPAGRFLHTAVWNGTEMIVWGGFSGSANLSDGGRHHPTADGWSPTAQSSTVAARRDHTAVWTGREMLLFGGTSQGTLNDTHSYTPAQVMFLYRKP